MDIKYTFSTMSSVDYYLAHPNMYEKDRIWVLMLNEYLKKHTLGDDFKIVKDKETQKECVEIRMQGV